tara:strand:- start:412 stop:1437 length:1026 start_codon:yes stop_codon:yes gene_type:complete
MSGIRYTLFNTETGAASGFPFSPAAGAAQTTSFGFNVPGGNLESLIFRFTGTVTAADMDQDLMGAVSALRVIVNGETCFDHRTGYNDPANDTTCSQLTYFMNSIGFGLSAEVVASTTVKEAYLRVPLGRVLPPSISRIEYTLSTVVAGGGNQATGNPTVEVWGVYNDSMRSRTTIPAATSFVAGGGTEEVSVRIPANQPGVIAGILIQNQDDTDTDLEEVRVISQSAYSLEQNYWRYLGGDLMNNVMFGAAGGGGTAPQLQMQIAQLSPGTLFINTLGLSRSDELRLQITTAAAAAGNTFLFSPVLVAPVAAREGAQQVQTQAVVTDTSKAILDISGQADA